MRRQKGHAMVLGVLGRLRRHKADAARLSLRHTQCQAEVLRARIIELERSLAERSREPREGGATRDGEPHRLGVNVLRSALAAERAHLAAFEAEVQAARSQYGHAAHQSRTAQWIESQNVPVRRDE